MSPFHLSVAQMSEVFVSSTLVSARVYHPTHPEIISATPQKFRLELTEKKR